MLSAGAPRESSFQDFLRTALPNATIIHADCKHGARPDRLRPNRIRQVDECLRGEHEAAGTSLKALRSRVEAGAGEGDFHLIKSDLKGHEYPVFGAAMRDADEVLRGTSQIQVEMSRFATGGSVVNTWTSHCLGQLFFATFMAGGYFPVAAEQR